MRNTLISVVVTVMLFLVMGNSLVVGVNDYNSEDELDIYIVEDDELLSSDDEVVRLVGSEFELRVMVFDSNNDVVDDADVIISISDSDGEVVVSSWKESVEEYRDGVYALFVMTLDDVGVHELDVIVDYDDVMDDDTFSVDVSRYVDVDVPRLRCVIFDVDGNLIDGYSYSVYVRHNLYNATAVRIHFIDFENETYQLEYYDVGWHYVEEVELDVDDVDSGSLSSYDVEVEVVGSGGLVTSNDFSVHVSDRTLVSSPLFSVYEDEDDFVVGYTSFVKAYTVYRTDDIHNVHIPIDVSYVLDFTSLRRVEIDSFFGSRSGHRVVVSGADRDVSGNFIFDVDGYDFGTVFSDVRVTEYNDLSTFYGLLSSLSDFERTDVGDYFGDAVSLRKIGIPHQIEVSYR